MGGGGKISPAPPALTDSTKNGTLSSPWNRPTKSLRFLTSVSPVSTSPARPKIPAKKAAKGAAISLELREDERLLLPGGDLLHDVAQAQQLAAVGLAPRPIAEPLRGVVANLLQAHQGGQHQPLALDAIGLLQLLSEVLDGLASSAACLRDSGQKALISVLSGKSAMMLLSVLRRRRM